MPERNERVGYVCSVENQLNYNIKRLSYEVASFIIGWVFKIIY